MTWDEHFDRYALPDDVKVSVQLEPLSRIMASAELGALTESYLCWGLDLQTHATANEHATAHALNVSVPSQLGLVSAKSFRQPQSSPENQRSWLTSRTRIEWAPAAQLEAVLIIECILTVA